MWNISVKLFGIQTSGSGDVVFKEFLSITLAALRHDRVEPFGLFW